MHAKARRSARRRTAIVGAAVAVIVAGFAVRLVDIQVVNAQEHLDNRAAYSGIGFSQVLSGTRGSIVDGEGTVLASSTTQYSAQFDPVHVKDIEHVDEDGREYTVTWEESAADIGEIVGRSGDEVQAIVADALAADAASQYALLADDLTTQQYRELTALGLPYLSFHPVQSRAYPYGAVAGNLIGFVGDDGEPLAGYEAAENTCLQATDGSLTYQQGSDGLIIPGTEVTEAPVDGGTLQLTLDADLQWYMQQMIAEETQNQQAQAGAVMVVEVATGAVRAAAEYPTVDPNDPTAVDADDRGSRIFSRTFEPGSTFKAVTAATLLDQGAATPYTSVTASGHEAFPNGAVVGDSFQHAAFNYTLTGALIDSSNVALSKFGELVPDETRYEYLQKFGVGTKTDIGFPGEEPGLIYPPDQWGAQGHYATTFGQAFTTTMPQVVNAYQTLANDGVREPLHIVESCTKPDGTVTKPELSEPRRVVSEEAADTTIRLLENVATQGSLAPAVAVDGYRIGTKTGTAQKSDGHGGYKAGLYFTSIIGVVPADDPQYIVMVTLDEPTRVTSSAATAPALQKAVTQVVKNYRVMPSEKTEEPLPKFAE
ncbi:penicillin-binding protein 2 [Microbacterium oryzae]|uniref:Penicillin-binding protein 2 n=1 Tax=Microbacterium oryzae TaxID=743009 RepID=A0A6I6DZ11_9MICO|nr:penicillin-binding protein 2 [Microbacterium oryzae]QGU27194.1 penicillin-binding protein 2 [Microbacterium oryzae]